jgi:hypothetical protein
MSRSKRTWNPSEKLSNEKPPYPSRAERLEKNKMTMIHKAVHLESGAKVRI